MARRADTVARFGGEEFLLILRDSGGEGALHLMMRLRRHWAREERLTTTSFIDRPPAALAANSSCAICSAARTAMRSAPITLPESRIEFILRST